ncbi:SIP domain-containing protein [Iamia sp. SCSIO 61187]|uniref:SIP domain-containing protein n=1 Tax=Iamia sp. SCSIO 61187 TaxID=2722752 RepID=UPI001C627B6C|nr:SIP domain-containing protein [Iamia sp. SCSIO 61187]QYG95118.1 SIP domain-containing protein [Iamia sp. SCSIO 61187]
MTDAATTTPPTAAAVEASEPDAIATYLATDGADVVARMNTDFADAVLLVGRVLGGRPEATSAALVGLDARGVDAVAVDAEDEHRCRVDFDEEVTDPLMFTAALLGLVVRAREVSGEEGLTRAEQEVARLSAIRTFVTSVVAVEDVHPHLRQITFGGGDLHAFVPNGPDAFVYVLLPPPGRTELTVDQSFSWEAVPDMAEADRPVGAYYTVRRWRPEAGELDVLFVLHGDTGPASAWAARAQVGDPVALWGPRTSWDPPADTDHYVLVADETGLPAVAGVLDLLPPEASIQVVAEVASPAERQDLPDHPGATVTWLSRGGAEAGTATHLLVDAVRSLEWRGDHPYVFGGGESRALTEVRRHVRDERGCPREAVSLVAYWRHAADTDDAVEAAAADDGVEAAAAAG